MRKVLFATRTYPMWRISLLLMLGLVLLSTVAYSQETASIVGTVTDQTGAAVPGAKITITNMDTGIVRSSTSNSTGSYNAPSSRSESIRFGWRQRALRRMNRSASRST